MAVYNQSTIIESYVAFEGFPAPPNTDLAGYHAYIDEAIPPESPYLYGLHPNAEIGFLTTTTENLFKTVFEMQPRDTGSSGGQTVTREEKVTGNDYLRDIKPTSLFDLAGCLVGVAGTATPNCKPDRIVDEKERKKISGYRCFYIFYYPQLSSNDCYYESMNLLSKTNVNY
jgi:hypothetical protein